MKKYYIEVNKERKGPFDLPDLIKQDVFPNTLIWHEGLTDWTPASQFAELKPVIKEQKPASYKLQNLAKYKWNILGAIGLIVFIIASRYSINNTSEEKPTVQKTGVEKDISEQSNEASTSNSDNQDTKQKQQYEENVEINKRYIRNNWTNYFKTWTNLPTIESLGGVSNLRVMFENKTGYLVDNVSAEIDIYTANGSIYKTEYIFLTNVPAYKIQSYKVPYSNRGSSVSSPRITSIKSSLLNFCYYTYGNQSGGQDDPFRCQ